MKTADNQYIRDINTSIILENIITHQPISRIEIANKTNLNRSTVTRILTNLLDKEIVEEIGIANKDKAGRKPILLKTNEKAGHTIAIEVNDKFMYGVLTNLNGNIIYESKIELSNTDQNTFTPIIVEFIKEFYNKSPKSTYGIVGISIGVHGMVTNDDIIEFAPYLGWKNYDIKGELEKHFDTLIHIENEANLSALGEHIFSRNYNNMININISDNGIGVGILIGGKLYNGFSGFSGEVGHMIVVPNGRPCPCGNKGCWEQYASKHAFIESIRKTGIELANIKDSKESIDAVDSFYNYLSIGINNLITIFNPEAIILNSSIFKFLDKPIKHINDSLNSYINKDFTLYLSRLENKACVLGGASVSIKSFYNVKYITINES